MALLTITEQQTIKPIVQNWANKVQVAGGKTNFEIIVSEIEESTIADLLGWPLLQDIQSAPTSTENALILNGSTFTDANNNIVMFKGLKHIIAYLVHYRYVNITTVSETATGLVSKQSDESNKASSGEKNEYRNYSKEIAYKQIELLKLFLNKNKENYPLWVATDSKKTSTPRIKNLKTTSNYNGMRWQI